MPSLVSVAIGGSYGSNKLAIHIKSDGVGARDRRICASTAETTGPGAARRARAASSGAGRETGTTAANGRASSTRRTAATRRARAASSGAGRETGATAANGRASSARRTTTRRARAASSGTGHETGCAATDRRASAHPTTTRHACAGHRYPVPASRSASCGATGRTLACSTTRASANHRAITRPCWPPAGSAGSHARPVATRAAHS
jgi:hypothetical protein